MPIDDFRIKVNKLPLPVKKVILSNKAFEIVSDVINNYKLNTKQGEKIAQITGKVLIKEIPLNDFVNNLKTQANLNLETAKSLAFDIIKNLFLPIKQYFPSAEELMRRLKPGQVRPGDSNIIDLKNQ